MPKSFDSLENLLSVVVPVFNERDSIHPLIAEIIDALSGQCVFEIVYMDDGSTDGTAEVLRELESARVSDFRVGYHDSRHGQSSAIVSGIRLARGAWIATLDGDGQNVPGDIPKLLRKVRAAWEQDPDVVCIAGIRVGRRDSTVRRLSSRIANGIRGWLLGDGIPDTGCGLKVFRRDAFMALPHFDHIHRFIPAMFKFCHGKVLTEAVVHRPRLRGTSKYNINNRLWVGIVDLAGVSWLRSRAIHQPWKAAP